MTFEEWFTSLNDDEPVALKDLLETCWHDAVIEGRNLQIFKDDAERANEFDPDWDGTLELVEEIKRLAIENERLRHREIKYEDWEFNPMTGESLWGKQPVSQEPVRLRRGDVLRCKETDELCLVWTLSTTGDAFIKWGPNDFGHYTAQQIGDLFWIEPKIVGEPVAWMRPNGEVFKELEIARLGLEIGIKPIPLYVAPVRTKDLSDDEIADALYGKGCWRLGVHPVHLREYRRVIQADRELNK